MTERCTNNTHQDKDWEAASLALVRLWGVIGRSQRGREIDDKDAQILRELHESLANVASTHAALENWERGEAPTTPFPSSLAQGYYVEALLDAYRGLYPDQEPPTIERLQELFRGYDPDHFALSGERGESLYSLAKRAMFLSDYRGRGLSF